MFNKVYEKTKSFINETKVFLIIIIVILCLFNIKLSYFISSPGGLINLDKRIVVKDAHQKDGSINLSYVSQYDGNLMMILSSFVIPNFDLEKRDKVLQEGQTKEEYEYLNKILLQSSNNNAVIASYNLAYNTNHITDTKYYVGLIFDKDKTNIEVKDQLVKIDGVTIKDLKEYKDIVNQKNIGDKVIVEVISNNKKEARYAEIYELDGEKTTGLYVVPIIKSEELSQITFKFKDSESGPSGGLMIALSIYNKLSDKDIVKGRKIAGTGTIDADGTVGAISGVKYKIIGAVKNKADIFLVPKGDNYKEALEIVKQKKYNIKLYPVENIKEAVNKLMEE